MKPKKKNKKLIILAIILAIIVGVIVFVNKKDSLPLMNNHNFDTSTYTNTYSDEWHTYTFKYPAGVTVEYSIGGLNAGEVIVEEVQNRAISVKSGSSNDANYELCSLEVSTLDWPGGDYGSVEASAPVVELNGIQWRKNKYTSHPGSMLYEFKGVVWQAERDNFRYVFGTEQDNEKFCESIISTFDFDID